MRGAQAEGALAGDGHHGLPGRGEDDVREPPPVVAARPEARGHRERVWRGRDRRRAAGRRRRREGSGGPTGHPHAQRLHVLQSQGRPGGRAQAAHRQRERARLVGQRRRAAAAATTQQTPQQQAGTPPPPPPSPGGGQLGGATEAESPAAADERTSKSEVAAPAPARPSSGPDAAAAAAAAARDTATTGGVEATAAVAAKLDGIILECSGLDELAPVLQDKGDAKSSTPVEESGEEGATDSSAAAAATLVKSQLALSDRVLLNKSDLISPAQGDALVDAVKANFPGASVTRCERGKVDVDLVLGVDSFSLDKALEV
ncbi:unnamed protein product, partial [Ectocarpus fasciculatus]